MDFLSAPPSPSTAVLHAQQLLLWRSLLAYERTNPLHLSPIDHHHALVFTYRQALTFLSHHPVMWNEYLSYLASASLELGGVAEGVEEGWKEAHAAMPYSLTLGFMYAEWLEEKGRLADAKKLYEAMIEARKNRPRDVREREEEGPDDVRRRIPRIELGDDGKADGVQDGGRGAQGREDQRRRRSEEGGRRRGRRRAAGGRPPSRRRTRTPLHGVRPHPSIAEGCARIRAG